MYVALNGIRGESRAAATSKMEWFLIIANDFQPALDPLLGTQTKLYVRFI